MKSFSLLNANQDSLNPVHTFNTRYLSKVFDIVRDDSKAKMTSSYSNQNVKITHSNSLARKSVTNLGIILNPVT